MNLFENPINIQKFRSTNAIWNEMKLNSPMSVGYVTNLIESRSFETKEEWRDFYYESGKQRLELLKNKGYNKEFSLNFGRTEEELREYGKKMFLEIQRRGNPLQITLPECVFMVKYRVMGETWNGVIMREKNTVETLYRYLPMLSFVKVDGEADYKYGIDYEVYQGTQLVCAIQIKPLSYEKGSSPEILKAKHANKTKNELYMNEKGVPVHYIYSKIDGSVINADIVSKIYPTMTKQVA